MKSDSASSKQSFDRVFEENYEVIYRYLYRRFADEDVAADLASTTFIKACRSYGRYVPDKPVIHWLYRIAGNELKMYFRSHKTQVESLDELLKDGFEPASSYNLAQDLVDKESGAARHAQFIQAQRALISLPAKYQEVLALRFNEKQSIAAIAATLDKKEGTVKSILSRGLKMLRKRMDEAPVQPNADKRIIGIEGQSNKVTRGI